MAASSPLLGSVLRPYETSRRTALAKSRSSTAGGFAGTGQHASCLLYEGAAAVRFSGGTPCVLTSDVVRSGRSRSRSWWRHRPACWAASPAIGPRSCPRPTTPSCRWRTRCGQLRRNSDETPTAASRRPAEPSACGATSCTSRSATWTPSDRGQRPSMVTKGQAAGGGASPATRPGTRWAETRDAVCCFRCSALRVGLDRQREFDMVSTEKVPGSAEVRDQVLLQGGLGEVVQCGGEGDHRWRCG